MTTEKREFALDIFGRAVRPGDIVAANLHNPYWMGRRLQLYQVASVTPKGITVETGEHGGRIFTPFVAEGQFVLDPDTKGSYRAHEPGTGRKYDN